MLTDIQDIHAYVSDFLHGTDYELITLLIDPDNTLRVEIDRLQGTDVEFCAELNRHLAAFLDDRNEPDYAIEVGSVSIVEPFKTKMQFEKHLGHPVELLTPEGRKMRGLLVSVDEDTFSVDVEEKVTVQGKKRKQTQFVTHTWQYDEPKYVKYDLKF